MAPPLSDIDEQYLLDDNPFGYQPDIDIVYTPESRTLNTRKCCKGICIVGSMIFIAISASYGLYTFGTHLVHNTSIIPLG